MASHASLTILNALNTVGPSCCRASYVVIIFIVKACSFFIALWENNRNLLFRGVNVRAKLYLAT